MGKKLQKNKNVPLVLGGHRDIFKKVLHLFGEAQIVKVFLCQIIA